MPASYDLDEIKTAHRYALETVKKGENWLRVIAPLRHRLEHRNAYPVEIPVAWMAFYDTYFISYQDQLKPQVMSLLGPGLYPPKELADALGLFWDAVKSLKYYTPDSHPPSLLEGSLRRLSEAALILGEAIKGEEQFRAEQGSKGATVNVHAPEPTSEVSKPLTSGKPKRRKPGDSALLIIGALRSLAAAGEWDARECDIMARAGVPRSTYDFVCKRDKRVQEERREYDSRRLGRGPVYADDM